MSYDSRDDIILESDNWNYIDEFDMTLCNTCIQDSDVIISCEGCDEYYDPTTEEAKDNIIKDPYSNDYYCKECFSQKVKDENPNYQPSWQYRYKKDAYRATWDDSYEFPHEYYDSESENSSEDDY